VLRCFDAGNAQEEFGVKLQLGWQAGRDGQQANRRAMPEVSSEQFVVDSYTRLSEAEALKAIDKWWDDKGPEVEADVVRAFLSADEPPMPSDHIGCFVWYRLGFRLLQRKLRRLA
jgi:hypothetical protein